ncbi:MAG: LruC domain-containing protein [Cyclonatronaceae bacterium]
MFTQKFFYPIIVLIACAGLLLQSCDVSTPQADDDGADGFNSLNIADDFNWSNSKELDLTINFADRALVDTPLEIYAEDERMIARLNILEDGIRFNEPLPNYIERLTLVNPATGHSQTVDAESGTILFEGYDVNKSAIDSYRDGNAQLFNTTLYYYHMYEDKWPYKGDYDFNDYTFKSTVEKQLDANNKVVGADVSVSFESMGAYFPYGLGVEVLRGTDATSTYLPTDAITFSGDATAEAGASNVARLIDNLKDVDEAMPTWNTFLERYETTPTTFNYSITWDEDSFGGNNISLHYFLFSSTDRGREIHSVGNPPTALSDGSELGTGEDNSSTVAWDRTPGRQFSKPAPFYRTENFLPWGLTLQIVPGIEPSIPTERTDITDAYDQFAGWAQSEGTLNTTWWFFPENGKVLVPPTP